MSCGITDPLGCAGHLVGSAAASAWDGICLSFAAAADALLGAFAKAFTAIPPVDLASPGVKNVYAICLGIAAVIAVLLLLGQVIRTALTHDGSALAQGLAGIGKAAAAFALTLVIASAAVTAADGLTSYIINASFGSAAKLTARITGLLQFAGTTAHPGTELAGGASLLLLLAIAGIVLILILWFELLLRNAAIIVLVATSPIAAAGMASAATRSWWPRTAAAAGQLIIVKPVVALVFALGLELTGTSRGVGDLLAGMLILLLAAVAWPVVARFFTFAGVSAAGSSTGLGVVLGFAAGRLSDGAGRLTGQASPGAEAGGEAAGAAGEGTAAATGVTAAAGGVLALAAAGARAAQRISAALAGRMDQVAGDAGLVPPGYGPFPPRAARPARPLRHGTTGGLAGGGDGQDGAGAGSWAWAADGTIPYGNASQAAYGQDWPEPDRDPWAEPEWPDAAPPGRGAVQDRPAAIDQVRGWAPAPAPEHDDGDDAGEEQW